MVDDSERKMICTDCIESLGASKKELGPVARGLLAAGLAFARTTIPLPGHCSTCNQDKPCVFRVPKDKEGS